MLTCKSNNKLTLPDGRELAYGEYGDASGFPVLYFHGFPGSRLEALFSVEMAHRLGARVIAVERPGYGLSCLQPQRQVQDWSDDVLSLADSLGLDEFSVLGVSAGSVYALVCAHRIPHRLRHVGIAGALAPPHLEHLRQKMNWLGRQCFSMTRRDHFPARVIYGHILASVIRYFPRVFLWSMLQSASDRDRGVLTLPEFRDAVLKSLQEAYRQGYAGPYQDLVLVSQDWGFSLDDIEIPVQLWHGEQDSVVPVEMGHMLAQQLCHCSARFLPEDGHFSMTVNHMEDALRTLIAPAKYSGDNRNTHKSACV